LLSLASVGKVGVSISQTAQYSHKESANVMGRVPGYEKPEQIVVVGAHLDTQLAGGVWDNGTGLAGMLEIARVIAGCRPKRSVLFIAFAGEECGEWGSFNYVDRHREEINHGNHVCMCNLDSVSSIFSSANTVWSSPQLRNFAFSAAKDAQWPVEAEGDFSTRLRELSDQCAFHEAGIPAAWIWEQSYAHPYYHTEKDVLEHINPEKWMKTLSVTLNLALKAASMPILPFFPSP